MRQILFPVDFSERTHHAAPFVAEMARKYNAEVVLLNAVSRADYVIGAGEAGVYGMEDLYQHALVHLRQTLDHYLETEFEGIPVKRVVAEGIPADEILKYERENGVWMIMMPTHGLGPFRRFILGSVTAKVLHDAHCPVWTSSHIENAPIPGKHSIERVLCAVDLDERSEGVIRFAHRLASEAHAPLTVCHVVPAAEIRPNRYLDQEFAESLIRDARHDIDAILKRTGISATICIQSGKLATGIRLAAEAHRSDAIVIGRGEAAVGGGRLRTHAYSIVSDAPVPVISV